MNDSVVLAIGLVAMATVFAADGPYSAGTFAPINRRYTVIWPR